jgi:hypothetical protein
MKLDELKENFNLGRKYQLCQNFDLGVSKPIDETVIKEIYSELSQD